MFTLSIVRLVILYFLAIYMISNDLHNLLMIFVICLRFAFHLNSNVFHVRVFTYCEGFAFFLFSRKIESIIDECRFNAFIIIVSVF